MNVFNMIVALLVYMLVIVIILAGVMFASWGYRSFKDAFDLEDAIGSIILIIAAAGLILLGISVLLLETGVIT